MNEWFESPIEDIEMEMQLKFIQDSWNLEDFKCSQNIFYNFIDVDQSLANRSDRAESIRTLEEE